jgi:hypothetical protein
MATVETDTSTKGGDPSRGLKFAWILMVVVGLVPFGYGAAFVVAWLSSIAANNPAILRMVESSSDVFALKEDLGTVFWGSFIIVLSWKGLRRGAKWAWYLLMLVPIYYLGQLAMGWSTDATVQISLAVLSAIALVLPYGYFESALGKELRS